MNNKEKRALLRKMLALLEDANSLEREPTYNPVRHGFPISQAIRDEILDIATDYGEMPQIQMVEKTDGTFAYTDGMFAYTICDCGGKAYIKERVHDSGSAVAKCAKCGKVLDDENGMLRAVNWTNEVPPENLFAEEKEPTETSLKDVRKIVDPTGKNPTVYKCPFCDAFTITQNGTTCITGDPNGKCSQCGKVFMLLGERKEGNHA